MWRTVFFNETHRNARLACIRNVNKEKIIMLIKEAFMDQANANFQAPYTAKSEKYSGTRRNQLERLFR